MLSDMLCIELEVREEQQLEELGFYRSQETELRATINELEEMQTQLTSRIAAEEQILEAARSQASVAAKGREFVDLQVRELSDQYDRACEHNRQLEAESTDMRVSLTQCQTELLQAKDKIAQLESVVQTVESNTNLSVEVSYLRTQMADMRKKLIRKDMTDLESGSSSSKALRDRENSSRLVYEGIILDLRTEIERLTVQYHDNQARHEELLKKASRVDQLEEEVRLYKECVTSNGMENDAIHTSYSEALERSEKSSHEKHLILRDLKTVELENESLQTKLTQLTDELNLEKAKYKKMHIDKLAAERRCSELLASRSKAEAALDEVKQGYDTELLELDRLRRGQRESHLVCEDLKRVANESAGREQEAERKSQELRESLTEVLGREQSLKNELSLLQTVKVSVDKELSSLQYTLRNQSAELEQKDVENDNLNKMITDLQREREKLCKDVALQEQSRAEIQLSTLRNELDQTVHDWKTTESVADEYVKEIQRLKQENLNEKEKIKLYKNQIALLEDRVKVALHELSVYRSLDVYHTTVSSELGHVREENLSNSRRSPVHHTHPHQDVPFGSPAAVAVSRGLDIGGSNRSHYSPSQQQQQHYSPQPQYPLREDLYAGVPSHGYGQGLGLSQSQFAARSQSSTLDYSARQHHDRDRDNHQYYQSKDSHWNIDSQVSTSSLPPPPYNHLRLEEELYQQRRQLRAEREAKKEKLLLQELNTGKPAVQSLYSQSHRQAQNLSQSRLDAESSLYSSSAGSTYRYTSPTFERPAPVYTSSMDTSRSIATTSRPKSGNTGAASSDSSALISRLRQSYLSKEGNSDNISKPQSEKLPSYIPSYFPSPSGTVDEPANIGQEHGRDTGSSSRNSNSSLLNKATGSTSMVSKAEYEKAKLRLSRR